MCRIDTSIKGFEAVGIKITEQQFEELCALNMQCLAEPGKEVPVFNMVVLLRILGVLPADMLTEPMRDLSEYERKFGVRKKV